MMTALHSYWRRPWAGALVLLTGLLLSSRVSQAQVDTYAFAASNGTFTALPATATPVTTISSDDAVTGAIPIPFSFVFDGTPYTQVYANSNGFLSFNAATPSSGSYTNALSSTGATYRPLIAPFWDDLTGSGGTASYATTGTAPNRVFTFEWLNWSELSASGAQLSFQVQLVEGSNVVRMVYRQEATPLSSASASIGLAGAGTGSGSFLSLNNATATASVSSTTETTTISTAPASGQIYTFTPAAPTLCPTPRNLTVTGLTATTATLGFTVSNTTPGPFTIVYGPTGFNPALASSPTNVYTTVTTSATTLNLTGLAVQTTYQFYVTQNCGGTNGSSVRSNAGSFTTPPVAPVNDDCAGAINVPIQFGSCVGQTSADNTAATASAGVPAPGCASYSGGDVWFKVTVPLSGILTVETVVPTAGSPIIDTGMAVYSGTCGTLALITCDDDSSPNGNFSLINLTGRTPGEVVYIRVWAYNNGNAGLLAVCITTPSNCAAPTGASSSNVTNTTAQLTWVAPAGGTGNTFELEYGLQGFVQGTGTAVTGISGATYGLTNLSPNTAYCYYVRQNCGTTNGSSSYAGPTCFTTPLTVPNNDEPCGAVALGTTLLNSTTIGSTTTVRNTIALPACTSAQAPKDVWFTMTASGTSVTLTVTGTPAGLVRLYTTSNCATDAFTFVTCQAAAGNNVGFTAPLVFTGLTAGQRYYVAVSGFGSSDTPGNFTIRASGVVSAATAKADTDALVVYPNPSSTGQLTLRLSGLGNTGQATLLNALGQSVLSKNLTGTTEQTLSTRGLAAGLYTLRVTIAGQVLTRKVVLE